MRRKLPRKYISDPSEIQTLNKKSLGSGFLHALDENPEFHDPYSELNLFLSRKIKHEMRHCSNSKKWSVKLQNQLLHKIAPEFQEKFPKYHLGISALKTSWEKVNYFSSQIQDQKQALTQDGKLNTTFFIKENLKTARKIQNVCHLHPYHYAHQLALKMSECIAVVDGIRPKLEELAKRIWAVQRHLIPELAPEHYKSPYDENDSIDRLIVKLTLDATSKHPQITQQELSSKVEAGLKLLKEWPNSFNHLQLKGCIAALLSEKLGNGKHYCEKNLNKAPFALIRAIEKEIASRLIDHPELTESQIVCDVLTYFKSSRLSIENTRDEDLDRKIHNWTMQSDMLLRWVRLDKTSCLYAQVANAWNAEIPSLEKFVQDQLLLFIQRNPNLSCFAGAIKTRIWTFLKSLWYTQEYTDTSTTYDRFIKWHAKLGTPLNKIQQLCKNALPLIPFDLSCARAVLPQEEEEASYEDHRQAK